MSFNDEAVLKVSGALSVAAAEDLRCRWLDWLGRGSGLVLDLSEVSSCDTAGVQMLLAARKSARHAGKPFRIAAQSDAVTKTCIELGIADVELAESDPVASEQGPAR